MTNLTNNFSSAIILSVVCTHPTTPASNGPVRLGTLCGVAERDEDAAGNTSVNFGPIVAAISVKGVDGSGNAAVAIGDKLYYTDADTPPVAKKTTGAFFGFALATVTSGSTGTIDVLVSR